MPDVIVRHLFYPDNKNRKYTISVFSDFYIEKLK